MGIYEKATSSMPLRDSYIRLYAHDGSRASGGAVIPASQRSDRPPTRRNPDGVYGAVHADREHISTEDAASGECVGDGAQCARCDGSETSREGGGSGR